MDFRPRDFGSALSSILGDAELLSRGRGLGEEEEEEPVDVCFSLPFDLNVALTYLTSASTPLRSVTR